MNVDLVAIEHGLVGARTCFEATNRGQHALASLTRPRAQHDGLRHPDASADRSEAMREATRKKWATQVARWRASGLTERAVVITTKDVDFANA